MASTGLIRIVLEDTSGPARPASTSSSHAPIGPAQHAPPGPRPLDRSLFGPPNVPNVPKTAPSTIRAEGRSVRFRRSRLLELSDARRTARIDFQAIPGSPRRRCRRRSRTEADSAPRAVDELRGNGAAKEPFAAHAQEVREHFANAATSAKNIESSFARIKAPEPKGSSNAKAPPLDSPAPQPRPQVPRTAAHPEPSEPTTYRFKETRDRLQAGPT